MSITFDLGEDTVFSHLLYPLHAGDPPSSNGRNSANGNCQMPLPEYGRVVVPFSATSQTKFLEERAAPLLRMQTTSSEQEGSAADSGDELLWDMKRAPYRHDVAAALHVILRGGRSCMIRDTRMCVAVMVGGDFLQADEILYVTPVAEFLMDCVMWMTWIHVPSFWHQNEWGQIASTSLSEEDTEFVNRVYQQCSSGRGPRHRRTPHLSSMNPGVALWDELGARRMLTIARLGLLDAAHDGRLNLHNEVISGDEITLANFGSPVTFLHLFEPGVLELRGPTLSADDALKLQHVELCRSSERKFPWKDLLQARNIQTFVQYSYFPSTSFCQDSLTVLRDFMGKNPRSRAKLTSLCARNEESLNSYSDSLRSLQYEGNGDGLANALGKAQHLTRLCLDNAMLTGYLGLSPSQNFTELRAQGHAGITSELLEGLPTSLRILDLGNNQLVRTIPHHLLNGLRCLNISGMEMTQESIKSATSLEQLNAKGCPRVNSIGFCAHSLTALNAAGTCGIDYEGLECGAKLRYLDIKHNENIRTWHPCAKSLTYLLVNDYHVLNKSVGKAPPPLTHLEVHGSKNGEMDLNCFGESLTHLELTSVKVGDESVSKLRKLQLLHLENCPNIRDFTPFAQNLRFLTISCSSLRHEDRSSVSPEDLRCLRRLVYVCSAHCPKLDVTSPSFIESATMRHPDAFVPFWNIHGCDWLKAPCSY